MCYFPVNHLVYVGGSFQQYRTITIPYKSVNLVLINLPLHFNPIKLDDQTCLGHIQ
ncbi:hypothetical protein ABEB36_007415 [Hypothenemus hampei]|uniref:Uncharacterized protein n=1 Tax=Hypothenemus hampei TaxID=57062 RepID=A0ABD1ETY3_HYPHA